MRKETNNQFTEGLVCDLNPINTPNTVLTDAVNATIITYNGNEFSLQNDMGNYPLENCKLKPNYIPVGLKEHGDILYIVSYNPLDNHVEIGTYPSPLQINTVDTDEDYSIEFGSIIKKELSKDKSEQKWNYKELVTNEQFIVFNGEDYKLYPGDSYRIDPEDSKKYKYETFEYYILDDASVLHDITEDVIKNENSLEYKYVSWTVPGWIAAKARLAQLSSSELNIRSFYAPLTGESREVYFNFNFRINVEDKIVNDILSENGTEDFAFRVNMTKNGEPIVWNETAKGSVDLKAENNSQWYLDNHIIWSTCKGSITSIGANDIIKVEVTPVITEYDNHNNVVYSIVYDNLTQEQEFDLSKVNDKPFGINDDFYKYYQTNSDEQVLEFNVSGPLITTSNVDLYYNIYSVDNQSGSPLISGKFEDYFGLGRNRVTIPFNDKFEKENVYIIEFEFRGEDKLTSTSKRRILITTELLDGNENVQVYDRDLTMDYLVEKYFDMIDVDYTLNTNDVIKNSKLICKNELLSDFCTNSSYSSFIRTGTLTSNRAEYDVETELQVEAELMTNFDCLKGPLWENFLEWSAYFGDTEVSMQEIGKTNCVFDTKSQTIISGELVPWGDPFDFYKVKDIRNLYTETPSYHISVYRGGGSYYSFQWKNNEGVIVRDVTTVPEFINEFQYPFSSYETEYRPILPCCYKLTVDGDLFSHMKSKRENIPTELLVFPGLINRESTDKNVSYAISKDKINPTFDTILNEIFIVMDSDAMFDSYDSYHTTFNIDSCETPYNIKISASILDDWSKRVELNVVFNDCLTLSTKPSKTIDLSHVSNVVPKSVSELVAEINEKVSAKVCEAQVNRWFTNPIYVNRNIKSEIRGVYSWSDNEKLNNIVKTLDNVFVNNVDYECEFDNYITDSFMFEYVVNSYAYYDIGLHEIGTVNDYEEIDSDNIK